MVAPYQFSWKVYPGESADSLVFIASLGPLKAVVVRNAAISPCTVRTYVHASPGQVDLVEVYRCGLCPGEGAHGPVSPT